MAAHRGNLFRRQITLLKMKAACACANGFHFEQGAGERHCRHCSRFGDEHRLKRDRDGGFLQEFFAALAEYDYRRVHAILKCQALAASLPARVTPQLLWEEHRASHTDG